MTTTTPYHPPLYPSPPGYPPGEPWQFNGYFGLDTRPADVVTAGGPAQTMPPGEHVLLSHLALRPLKGSRTAGAAVINLWLLNATAVRLSINHEAVLEVRTFDVARYGGEHCLRAGLDKRGERFFAVAGPSGGGVLLRPGEVFALDLIPTPHAWGGALERGLWRVPVWLRGTVWREPPPDLDLRRTTVVAEAEPAA